MAVDVIHEEKNTLAVDVNIPGHDVRVTTSLFERTKKLLIAREGARCWSCGCTAAEVGPLESHHHPVERSLANMWDWPRFITDCKAGMWGQYALRFDWDSFLAGATYEEVEVTPLDPSRPKYTVKVLRPVDPMKFVDDQTVNGRILCKPHHTGKNEGHHDLPYPFVIAQKYAYEGYRFSPNEVIHHDAEA